MEAEEAGQSMAVVLHEVGIIGCTHKVDPTAVCMCMCMYV